MTEKLSTVNIEDSEMTNMISQISTPFSVDTKDETGLNTKQVLWLHARVQRTCYIVYAEFKFTAWVTTDQAGNNLYAVDRVEVELSIGGGDFHNYSAVNSAIIERGEQEINMGCRNACCHGIATHKGFGRWETSNACIS